MEPERIIMLTLVSLFYVRHAVDAVVPYYYHRAKIEPASPQKEEERVQEQSFDPTHTICCKIGEKAARKRLSCTADTQILTRKMNHIHKVKVDFTEKKDGLDNTNTLFYKISKCAVSYSKYFMKCCNYKADFYKERRTCRTMETRFERQKCREDIKKKYS